MIRLVARALDVHVSDSSVLPLMPAPRLEFVLLVRRGDGAIFSTRACLNLVQSLLASSLPPSPSSSSSPATMGGYDVIYNGETAVQMFGSLGIDFDLSEYQVRRISLLSFPSFQREHSSFFSFDRCLPGLLRT